MVETVRIAEQEGLGQNVLELTYVSGPCMGHERTERTRAEHGTLAVVTLTNAGENAFGDGGIMGKVSE